MSWSIRRERKFTNHPPNLQQTGVRGVSALIMLEKILQAGRQTLAVLAVALACGTISGCISSSNPILGDARAILGERIQVHAFSPSKDGARDQSVSSFEWSGSRYVPRGATELREFTIHPYEGRDLIVQMQAGRTGSRSEYALARRIAEGVYLILPISEEDADEPTRERFCTKTRDASCLITTPEQLFVFARATAARDEDNGGIAVVVPMRR
jgi:hypothetical protein